MTPSSVLAQYLDGAITFAEFVAWMAAYHVEKEVICASLIVPQCANCGGNLADRR